MTEILTEFLHKDVWQKAKAELSSAVSAEIFTSWFENIECLGGTENSISLGVPGEFAAIWIRDNYLDIISANLSMAAGRKLNVEIKSVETTEEPKPEEQAAARRHSVHVAASKPKTLPSINPRNTFECFVVGESNKFAHAAGLAVAQAPGKAFNPLFIYGATGLGKTHLMHAIAHFVLRNNPSSSIVYLSSENFVNEYVDALKDGNIVKFRKRYRNTDVLLIDDVQFFAGKERCQEEFFHTFNELFNAGKQIVLSCDKPISEVSDIEQRLVSRFGWGVSVDIQAPDYETRLAILQKKLAALKCEAAISPEAIDLLARRFTKNIRRMEGALTNLVGYASLVNSNNAITLEKAQELLANVLLMEDDNQLINIEQIQKKTAEYYKIDVSDMTSKRRPASIAMARQIAMYLSRKLTTHSLQEIGKLFGGRDHGTVMHAIRVVDHATNHDENVRRSVEYLMKTLSV